MGIIGKQYVRMGKSHRILSKSTKKKKVAKLGMDGLPETHNIVLGLMHVLYMYV